MLVFDDALSTRTPLKMKQYTLQETTTEGLKPLANPSIFNTNRLSGRIREIILF